MWGSSFDKAPHSDTTTGAIFSSKEISTIYSISSEDKQVFHGIEISLQRYHENLKQEPKYLKPYSRNQLTEFIYSLVYHGFVDENSSLWKTGLIVIPVEEEIGVRYYYLRKSFLGVELHARPYLAKPCTFQGTSCVLLQNTQQNNNTSIKTWY
jgi:hypothetical protein